MRPPYCAFCHELTTTATMVAFADYRPLEAGMIGHPHGLEWFCEKHLAAAKRNAHLPMNEAIARIGQRRRWWPFAS